MSIVAPCYKCESRQLGCHDSCGEYKEFKYGLKVTEDNRRQFMLNRSVVIESSLRQTLSKMK